MPLSSQALSKEGTVNSVLALLCKATFKIELRKVISCLKKIQFCTSKCTWPDVFQSLNLFNVHVHSAQKEQRE